MLFRSEDQKDEEDEEDERTRRSRWMGPLPPLHSSIGRQSHQGHYRDPAPKSKTSELKFQGRDPSQEIQVEVAELLLVLVKIKLLSRDIELNSQVTRDKPSI